MENRIDEIMLTLAIIGERLERAEILAERLTGGDFGYPQEHHIKDDGRTLVYNYPEHKAIIGVLSDYINLCAEDADRAWKALDKVGMDAKNK